MMVQADSGRSYAATIKVAAIDDHPAILAGVRDGLAQALPEAVMVHMAATVAELIAAGVPADVVLLDIVLADGSAPEDNVHVLREAGHKVLLYSQDRRPGVIGRALRAGALGIVGKHEPFGTIAEAIQHAARDEAHLSSDWAAALLAQVAAVPELAARESEALQLYAAGLPVGTVAETMGVGTETVREYLLRVRRKYAEVARPASTKLDLYHRAVEDGWLSPPDHS